jgi:hypothetical protein
MEPSRGFINIQGQLAPLNWLISLKSFTVDVNCNKCTIPNYSHTSWHVRVYFME